MDAMELLDRYLHAVGFWLPAKQRQDIIAELSEDLHSQIEEKEKELGRKLSASEVEVILKQRGRPVLVANRYLPQRYLIGPMLFPIYRFVLGIVMLCYLVPWVLVTIGLLTFNSAYHAGSNWGQALVSRWGPLWLSASIAAGVVTIVFAALERANAKSHFLEEWEPRKLPAVRDPNRIPRSSSGFEAGVGLAFCIWWISSMASVVVINRPQVRITLSPLWPYFFWGFLLVMLVNIPLSVTNLILPYWTRPRAALRLITDLSASALFCWLVKANIFAEITAANVPAARTWQITNALNLWMGRMLPIAVIIGVVILANNIYRIIRLKMAASGAPLAVSTSGFHAN